MKKTIILSAVLILTLFIIIFTGVMIQQRKTDEFQTLFGNEKHNGAYGAFTIGYSEIDDKQAVTIRRKIRMDSQAIQ